MKKNNSYEVRLVREEEYLNGAPYQNILTVHIKAPYLQVAKARAQFAYLAYRVLPD